MNDIQAIPAVREFKTLHEVIADADTKPKRGMGTVTAKAPRDYIERFSSICTTQGKTISDVIRAFVVTTVDEFNSCDA